MNPNQKKINHVNIVDARSMVSSTLKSDRTCKYCNKEFNYPYIFKRHKNTKCWINSKSLKINDEASKLNNESSKLNDESSKFNNETTVPIHLSLA